VTGCHDDSARVADVAHQALESQAEQNKELARLSGEVVESSQQLVEHDAQARIEILSAQRDLQTQQSDVSRQRDDLEHQRQRIAALRTSESLLAPILLTLGTAFLCLLPIAVAGYVLYLSRSGVPEMAEVGQILIEELVSETPRLLPPPAPPSTRRLEPPAEYPPG
jgi:ABC-type transporter Mla subunit MlaD